MTIRLFNFAGLINSSTSTNSSLFINFSGLADGYYYLNATAYGLFGNPNSTETRTILLDTNAPNISLLTPTNNSFSNASIVNFTANIQDLFSNGNLCYQETANASTAGDGSCELNYSGRYGFSDNSNDGNLNTYYTTTSGMGDKYINYTKPAKVINSSIWFSSYFTVNALFETTNRTTNISIPSSCWTYLSDKIMFDINGTIAASNPRTRWYCYDGTWQLLKTSENTGSFGGSGIYEEAMIWGVGTGIGIANATLTIQNLSGYIINETTQTYAPGIFETIIGTPVYLIDGIYNWFFTATDYLSNVVQSVINTLTVDTTYPGITITYPTNGTYYNYVVTALNYTLSEINPDTCWYSANSGVTNSSVTCGVNLTGLTSTEGSNTWMVYANDSAGNQNSSSVTFSKDTILPL